ncbi:MAG TPA: phosphoribosylanthranilate isomerase [Bryobacteraceae bacterium]|jgi:phosphoribosylanthranilate isomerase|nr:phosphoribosylanthranilate isomerase [Bryobacteraceae bacterium]
MSFIVKVCGITNERDAEMAVAAGASALGFVFYRHSPRAVTLETVRQIACSLPDNILKVGVFLEPSEMELREAIDRAPLDVVQLHGKHVPSLAHRTWRALAASTADPSESLVAEALVLDTEAHGGTGRTFDWQLATRFWQPVIIAGGLDASNVAEAIEMGRPIGVDASSRLEARPGVKDPAKVRQFVEAARAAAAAFEEVTP